MRKLRYFVYLYRDPRPGKKWAPIYVGKGTTRTTSPYRAMLHWRVKSHNHILNSILGKVRTAGLEPKIEIVSYFDVERDAVEFETGLIAEFGRRCNKSGSLANIAESGWVHARSVEQQESHSATIKIAMGRPEVRARLSAAAYRKWRDPEFVERFKRAVRLAREIDPSIGEKHKTRVKALWTDPEYRQKCVERKAQRWAEPGMRERQAQILREAHLRPEVKARNSAGQRRRFARPEERTARSEQAKAARSRLSPEAAAELIAKQKAGLQRPEVKAKISASQRGRRSSEETRARISAGMKKHYAERTAEQAAARNAGISAGWARRTEPRRSRKKQ